MGHEGDSAQNIRFHFRPYVHMYIIMYQRCHLPQIDDPSSRGLMASQRRSESFASAAQVRYGSWEKVEKSNGHQPRRMIEPPGNKAMQSSKESQNSEGIAIHHSINCPLSNNFHSSCSELSRIVLRVCGVVLECAARHSASNAKTKTKKIKHGRR